MAEEKDMKQARNVFNALCESMDAQKWHYKKDEEGLCISCEMQGEDLSIPLKIRVDAKRQLVSILSPMPFTVAKERRAIMAIAVSQANNGMVDGNFDYDCLEGEICFRMTSSYRNSLIGKELFTYMVACASFTIDEYNDKFLMVAKKDMSVEEILEFIK